MLMYRVLEIMMSPSKQKTSERQAARDRKATARQVTGSSTSANAYNPVSGTFHALESISSDSGGNQMNGRFKSIDEGDDIASSNGGAGELECMSNNGSCSGESEDQSHSNGKEKLGTGRSGHSGVIGSADKRDKVRGKNERKHQRQKERRAQELRDKCNGYLMSYKLEALSQQLVAMGFPQERATMALILNDGHVERSVAWLLEGGEAQVHEDRNSGGNPKIDITEELNHILEIEKKYKFLRPDIERAIVASEGDIAKALESLQARSHCLSPGREEGQKTQATSNCSVDRKEEPSTSTPASSPGPVLSLHARNNGIVQPSYQIRKDERSSLQSSAKVRQQASCISSYTPQEILTRGSAHPRKLSNPSTEVPGSLLPAERQAHSQVPRIPVGTIKPQSSYASQFAPISKSHAGLLFGATGAESKLFPTTGRENNVNIPSKESTNTGQPYILLRASSQPFVSMNTSPSASPVPSSPALSTSSRSNSVRDVGSPSSVLYVNGSHADAGTKEMNVRKNLMKSCDIGAPDTTGFLNPLGSLQSEQIPVRWSYGQSSNFSSAASFSTTPSRNSSGSSYGLFTGWGSSLLQTSVDWSTGPSANCDYTTIDWSMNASPNSLRGVSTRFNSLTVQEKGSLLWSSDEGRAFHTGLGSANYVTEAAKGKAKWKLGSSSGPVVQDSASLDSGSAAHDWTSPFAGKDLFNFPQAVPSPSL
ncbi:hypothetical protein KP509_25G013900 [Ceratopteris richardii]|uniref:UBA domain-containing protein n=1 Tax=Ceratopteris richardii TaxID=49495 RepID=A0A8T2RQU3_CERRI|nr:hypothetical protein KP509_25G013900 [Ceratopteris richardii]